MVKTLFKPPIWSKVWLFESLKARKVAKDTKTAEAKAKSWIPDRSFFAWNDKGGGTCRNDTGFLTIVKQPFTTKQTSVIINGVEMPLENVIYETINSIAHITIDRPHKLNSLNSRTLSEIMDVFSLAASDPQVKAVILIGAGDKAFVAGADIEELSELNPLGGKRFAERGQEIFNFIENMSKPVIAAVNGFALGGGCELCMACHIRIASENAKFGQPEVKLGLIPGFGGTQRLPRLIGKGRALEMILTGDMIDANEACRIGLVNKIVPYAGFIAWTFILTTEAPNSLTFSSVMFSLSIIALAVGSLTIPSIGKGVSSIIATSPKPAPLIASR